MIIENLKINNFVFLHDIKKNIDIDERFTIYNIINDKVIIRSDITGDMYEFNINEFEIGLLEKNIFVFDNKDYSENEKDNTMYYILNDLADTFTLSKEISFNELNLVGKERALLIDEPGVLIQYGNPENDLLFLCKKSDYEGYIKI